MPTTLPLIDPHCHLGGSIPTEFVWDVIQAGNLYHLANSHTEVVQQMTFGIDETPGFHRFLNKFRLLDNIVWTEELIDKSIRAVCDNLEVQNIDFVWMDFSINKYMGIGWEKHEAVRFIHDRFKSHRPGGVGLILSLKYESSHSSQREFAALIHDHRIVDHIIGIDLVGDETYYKADFYSPLFTNWRSAGKICRAHVGEFGDIENIYTAITKLCVTNIAHGFKIIDNPRYTQLALEADITFDMALTSNDLTGVTIKAQHPIKRMLDAGLKITLGSDDPIVCNTTLSQEFLISREYGLTDIDHRQIRTTAYINSRRFIP